MNSLSEQEVKIDYSKFRERMKRFKHDGTSLANLIGYSPSTLNESLRTGRPISAKYINKIATALRMTADEVCEELIGISIKPAEPTPEEVIDAFAKAILERSKKICS